MVGGTDAFLVVVGCVGTTSAGGNSGLHWKIDLVFFVLGVFVWVSGVRPKLRTII